MTLAIAILLFGISSAALPIPSTPAQEQPSAQSPNPSSNAQTNDAKTNKADPAQEPSGTTPAQGSSETASPTASQKPRPEKATPKKASAKKKSRKKKSVAAGCDKAPSPASAPESSSSIQSGQPAQADPHTATAPSTSQAPKDCPPSITVVRHGGAIEPSIQLAGGPGGDEASQKRNATNQLLGSAEANLKKISAIQLNQAQQDTVTQIRQFVDQSKAALAAGELERGHTLAWKAQLLSEDLLKPQK